MQAVRGLFLLPVRLYPAGRFSSCVPLCGRYTHNHHEQTEGTVDGEAACWDVLASHNSSACRYILPLEANAMLQYTPTPAMQEACQSFIQQDTHTHTHTHTQMTVHVKLSCSKHVCFLMFRVGCLRFWILGRAFQHQPSLKTTCCSNCWPRTKDW
jgi:hypothetical protein